MCFATSSLFMPLH